MIHTQVHLDTPPEDVFDVLQDGESYARWLVDAYWTRAVDGAIPETGGRLRHRLGARTARVDGDLRAVRSELPVLELKARGGPITAKVRFRLHPEQTGTTVALEQSGVGVVPGLAMPRWLANATARLFGLAAATRRTRALRPPGVNRAGEAELWVAARHLAHPSNTPVIVRFSRFSSIVRYQVGGAPVRFTAQVRGTALPLDRLPGVDSWRSHCWPRRTATGTEPPRSSSPSHRRIRHSFRPHAHRPGGGSVGVLDALRRPAYDASQAVRHDRRTVSSPRPADGHRSVT